MAESSKNLGQVAGLYVGTTAPTNKALIWYDTSSNVHKTFDVGLNAWTVLQPQTITPITYSALVSRASGQGLTQGQWFKITDRSNALALTITATKVQYVNNNGVPVVDDLGTHIMYNITSENLIIDDVTGVYDATTNKLTFSFSETTPVMNTGDSDVDYVLGEQKRGNIKTLRKFRLSSLLSTVTGNDISWNGGFFLNFYNKLKSYFDTTGGVASHAALEEYKTLNNQAIVNMTQTAQQAVETVGQNINQATSPAQIYSKELPIAPTDGVTADIAQGDTLSGIVVKIHRWINKFKKADGIAMPANYAPASTATPVNNNDSVSTAISKLSKYATNHNTGDGIQVSGQTFVPPTSNPGDIANTDNILTAIKKLLWLAKNINTAQILDNAVTERKLAVGVQQTDICRLDVNVLWPAGEQVATYILNNLSIGFCMIAGENGGFFQYDPTDPNNPYRITSAYWSGYKDYPVISFAPVLPPQNNTESDFSMASPMLHYVGHTPAGGVTVGAFFQSQVVIQQELFNKLQSLGLNYLKVTVNSVDLYNSQHTSTPFVTYVSLARVNIWGFILGLSFLQRGTGKHLVISATFEFTQTNG